MIDNSVVRENALPKPMTGPNTSSVYTAIFAA